MNYRILQKILIVVFVFSIVFAGKSAFALTVSPIKFELSGDPGQTVSEEITLINENDTDEVFYTSYANFEAQGETGNPNFVNPTDGLGTWMSTYSSVKLGPKEMKKMPLSITIPANAEPGGYFAAVFWGTEPPSENMVVIGARTGLLVLLRVNGDIDEKGGIVEYDTLQSKNFYTSLPVSFYYRFQNNGGDRIKPEGDIIIKHILGYTRARVPANIAEGNILPTQTRRFETTWQGKDGSNNVVDVENLGFLAQAKNQWSNFAFGYFKAQLLLRYGTDNALHDTKTVGFWVIPWQLLLLVLVVVGLVFFVLKKIIHQHNKALIERVRAQLKKESRDQSNENPSSSAQL